MAARRGSSWPSYRCSFLVLLDESLQHRIKWHSVALALVARMVPHVGLALFVAAPIICVAKFVAHLAPFQAMMARWAASMAA